MTGVLFRDILPVRCSKIGRLYKLLMPKLSKLGIKKEENIIKTDIDKNLKYDILDMSLGMKKLNKVI
jgi:hypothetical protein